MLLLVLLTGAAWPTTPADAMRTAAAAYREGRLDDALDAYRRAAAALPGRPEPVFNQGVIYYRRGDWDLAHERFAHVLEIGTRRLEAKAHFNLGNCQVARVRAGGQTREAALHRLQEAINHYRNALNLRPDWQEARANIQLVAMLMNQIPSGTGTGSPPEGSPQERDATKSSQDDDTTSNGSDPGSNGNGGLAGADVPPSNNGAGSPQPSPSPGGEGKPDREPPNQPGSGDQPTALSPKERHATSEKLTPEPPDRQPPRDPYSSSARPNRNAPDNEANQGVPGPASLPQEPGPSRAAAGPPSTGGGAERGTPPGPRPEPRTRSDPGGGTGHPSEELATSPEASQPLTREEAERILEMIREQHRQPPPRLPPPTASRAPVEKDW